MNDKKKQIAIIYFESDLEIKGIKQEQTTVKDETYLFPSAHQQVNVHVLKDPFARLLESSVEMDLMVFINHVDIFRCCVKFLSFIFFIPLEESKRRNQSSGHLLDWLHWISVITA